MRPWSIRVRGWKFYLFSLFFTKYGPKFLGGSINFLSGGITPSPLPVHTYAFEASLFTPIGSLFLVVIINVCTVSPATDVCVAIAEILWPNLTG